MNLKGMFRVWLMDRLTNTLAFVATAISSGVASTRIIIEPWQGGTVPAGATLKVEPLNQVNWFFVVLSSPVNNGDTEIVTESFTPTSDLVTSSKISVSEYNYHDRRFKEYNSTHIHFYHTGSSHGNDLLPTFTQFNWNINAGSVLTDGVSKPNRWGSQFSFLQAPDYKCKIERIIIQGSSNGLADEDWALRFWDKPVDPNGSSNTNMALIRQEDFISQNDQNYVFTRVYEPTGGYSMDSNNSLLLTFLKTGSATRSSTKFYADIEVIYSYYIK